MSNNAEFSAEIQKGTNSYDAIEQGAYSALMAECWRGGPIVTDPQECKDIDRSNTESPSSILPQLEFSDSLGSAIELAGKTKRNNGNGRITNERDAALDRRS